MSSKRARKKKQRGGNDGESRNARRGRKYGKMSSISKQDLVRLREAEGEGHEVRREVPPITSFISENGTFWLP